MLEFNNIALFIKIGHNLAQEVGQKLVNHLLEQQCNLFLDHECSNLFKNFPGKTLPRSKIAENCDLAIVIGGDGTMLKAARTIITNDVPLLGINLGHLGFLADIKSELMLPTINEILEGKFTQEERQVLTTTIYRDSKKYRDNHALNDVVLFNGDVARMIEFDIFIDDDFVSRQRSDGIIIATPTGSTAYSLSAGGPILHPSLAAIAIVPMCAHTLSSRPIIVHDSATVRLIMSQRKKVAPKLSCDGQVHFDLNPGDEICVQKYRDNLKLIHPESYNYYALLREKLCWNTQADARNN